MGSIRQCEEKSRLMRQYQCATQRFSAAVSKLTGEISETEYYSLLQIADRERMETMQARARLNGHVAEHGC